MTVQKLINHRFWVWRSCIIWSLQWGSEPFNGSGQNPDQNVPDLIVKIWNIQKLVDETKCVNNALLRNGLSQISSQNTSSNEHVWLQERVLCFVFLFLHFITSNFCSNWLSCLVKCMKWAEICNWISLCSAKDIYKICKWESIHK